MSIPVWVLVRRVLVVAVVGLVGCGGAGGPCAQRTGTGTMKLTANGGNCGAVPDTVVDGQPAAPTPPCTGTVTHSADNCEMTFDQTCPGAQGVTVRQKGTGTFSPDGKTGTATFAFTVTDANGAMACSGMYGATFTKN